MRIQSSNKALYDINPKGSPKEERLKCPACSHTHSVHKQSQRDLAWDNSQNRGYCHRCNESFFEYNPHQQEKDYVIPEWENKTDLSDEAAKFWESRMISQKTLKKCKVYSTRQWMPQFQKEVKVMAFPYERQGKLVNVKYRGPKKSMKMVSGAELMFLNEDCLRDNSWVIIVEGEPDYLTYVENGYTNVLSTPNGANAKQMEYFEKAKELFDKLETVYIGVDNDTEGLKLRDELVRRIGPEKCKLINYKDCKDANDYFVKHGGLEFKKLVEEAKDVPVEGVVEVPDLYQDLVSFFKEGIQPGKTIGFDPLDEIATWELGRLAVVTGTPGSGKSEIVDFIVSKMNLLYGWKAAYYSPENYPLKYHYAKLYEKFVGKKFSQKDSQEIDFDIAYEHIRENFFYIMNDYDMTLEGILQGAEYYVKKKGINILVVDPYNRIEHEKKSGERDDQYVSRFLNRLDRFAKLNNLLVFLVAHPITMRDKEMPNLYDISGGSNFYNKAEYGVVVGREKNEQGVMTHNVVVKFEKIKFKHLGYQGIAKVLYNYKNGRLEPRGDVLHHDNSNWLVTPPAMHEMEENYEFLNGQENELPY
jgi:twinkle protein